jgi:hypothetical protein
MGIEKILVSRTYGIGFGKERFQLLTLVINDILGFPVLTLDEKIFIGNIFRIKEICMRHLCYFC